MDGDETASATQGLPRIHLRVDRWQAMMRGMWRLLLAAMTGGGCFVLLLPNWRLLWETQMASFLALVTVFVLLGAITIGLAVSMVRWMLVAMWWKPMGIEIGAEGIRLSLGPGGNLSRPWSQLRIVLDEAVDWDFLEQMPDDAFVPKIVDRASGVDVGERIVKYSGISHEAFTRYLRPYLMHPPCPEG